MKKIYYILLLSIITTTSCIRDIEFDYDEVSSQVVVNSLFTTDAPWEVLLSYSKATGDSTDQYIDNATVSICSENEEIIPEYAGDGKYTSESYPRTGTLYTITVEVPGFETITASSSVPGKPECKLEPFDTVFSKYMFPNDLIDYEVLPLTVDINNPDKLYYLFGFEGYPPVYRYYISPEAIANMREDGIPGDILDVLDNLYGQYYGSRYFIQEYVRQFSDEYTTGELSTYEYIIMNDVIKERIEEYNPARYYAIPIFSDCEWLSNISSDTYAIVGENKNKQSAGVFLGDQNLPWDMQNKSKRGREYWLKIETCSSDFYQYYKTYSLQVSQRLNPYAEAIEVYSNITNGLGIFAGYNQQRIHVLDY